MKLIVAVDSKWGIGKNNDLLFHLKADMRHFVEHTKGKIVIMGANTLRSFPNGMPLKGRTNIVLNPDGSQKDAYEKGYILAKSLENLFEILGEYDTSDAYVIGGAMMYHTMLPYCEEAVITKVDADGEASVFFDNLDELENWECNDVSEPIDDNGYTIRFCTYKNNEVNEFYQITDEGITSNPSFIQKIVKKDDFDYIDPTSEERTFEKAQKLWYKYAFFGAVIILIFALVFFAAAMGKFATANREINIDNYNKYISLSDRYSENQNTNISMGFIDVKISNISDYMLTNLYIKFSMENEDGEIDIIERTLSEWKPSSYIYIKSNVGKSISTKILEISGEVIYGYGW